MKIVLYSHSYLEPENQKNISSLAAFSDVRCALPNRGRVLIFSEYRFKTNQENAGLFCSLMPLYLSQSQYLLKSLISALRRYQPDIINVEYNPWSIMFLQAAVSRSLCCPKARLICTVKKNTYRKRGLRGYLKDRLARYALRQVDHIIAVSGMVAQLLESEFSFPSSDVTVCPHLGVDVDLFKPKAAGFDDIKRSIVIGYCGRLDADKGVTDLVAAVRRIKQKISRPVLLRLLGCGAYSGKLDSQLARDQEKYPWLEILPPVPNAEVAAFLQELDIFALPSRILDDHQEHDAHALIEALATGVASVGTTSGIIPEILGEYAGCLVKPERPDELDAALVGLIENNEERRALALRGREKAVKEFALEVIARRKIDIFRRVLNEGDAKYKPVL